MHTFFFKAKIIDVEETIFFNFFKGALNDKSKFVHQNLIL